MVGFVYAGDVYYAGCSNWQPFRRLATGQARPQIAKPLSREKIFLHNGRYAVIKLAATIICTSLGAGERLRGKAG